MQYATSKKKHSRVTENRRVYLDVENVHKIAIILVGVASGTKRIAQNKPPRAGSLAIVD